MEKIETNEKMKKLIKRYAIKHNKSTVEDTIAWVDTQLNNYRNEFGAYLDSKKYDRVLEVMQDADNYINNNPLLLTVRPQIIHHEDEVEYCKDVLIDKVDTYGDSLLDALKHELHMLELEDMQPKDLHDFIDFTIDTYNIYSADLQI